MPLHLTATDTVGPSGAPQATELTGSLRAGTLPRPGPRGQCVNAMSKIVDTVSAVLYIAYVNDC